MIHNSSVRTFDSKSDLSCAIANLLAEDIRVFTILYYNVAGPVKIFPFQPSPAESVIEILIVKILGHPVVGQKVERMVIIPYAVPLGLSLMTVPSGAFIVKPT